MGKPVLKPKEKETPTKTGNSPGKIAPETEGRRSFEHDSEEISLDDSLSASLLFRRVEDNRQERADKLAKLRREQTEKAEREAHKKDASILEFEKEFLAKSDASSRVTFNNNKKSLETDTTEDDAHVRTKAGCSKKRIFKYMVLTVAWWDLVMALMTLIQIQSQEILLEMILLDGYYNCVETVKQAGKYLRWVYALHGCASLLLMFSLSRRDAYKMLVWFASKSILLVVFGFRHIYDLRIQQDQETVMAKRAAFALTVLIFYSIQFAIVIIMYLIYMKPNVERRRKLLSNRPLNRDIHLKSLSPFMQRKYAVRWAEKLQATIVLQRIRDRDEKHRGKNRISNIGPTDDELLMDVEDGVQAFRKANNFDITDIDNSDNVAPTKAKFRE